MYKLIKTVILTVDAVDSRARVIVYPLAISRSSKRKAISLAPWKNPPKIVNGPIPLTAYFAHVTEFNKTPDQWSMALRV